MATAMFESAESVLGALVDRPVKAGPVSVSQHEGSILVGKDYMATLVTLPSAGVTFVVRYPTAELGKVVELMLGTTSNGGEMDAMQRSIVSETVSQISGAMAEKLAGSLGVSPDGIHAEVSEDASAFPAPPFQSHESEMAVGDALTATVSIDFDGVALGKINERIAPPPPAPKAEPAAAPAPAARRAPPPPASQPVAYPSMPPTPIHAASPGHANLDLVHDIPLQISAVLGQTALSLRDVVALQTGSVFELDKLSTDPIDLYVNNILIARGEVVVVDDKFAVKISELNPSSEKV
jgi:flagellar motor switch protein FliN